MEFENFDVLGKKENTEKLEKLPFSLAKKMPLILYLFAQAQSSLTSSGVSSVLMDEKCKLFPDHLLTCTCARTRVHDLFYFLNHRGRMHRLLIWIKYCYFFPVSLTGVCIRKCCMRLVMLVKQWIIIIVTMCLNAFV